MSNRYAMIERDASTVIVLRTNGRSVEAAVVEHRSGESKIEVDAWVTVGKLNAEGLARLRDSGLGRAVAFHLLDFFFLHAPQLSAKG